MAFHAEVYMAGWVGVLHFIYVSCDVGCAAVVPETQSLQCCTYDVSLTA